MSSKVVLDGVLFVIFMAEGQIVGECLLFKTGPLIKRTMKKCETLVDDMHAEGCMHDMCQRQRFTS